MCEWKKDRGVRFLPWVQKVRGRGITLYTRPFNDGTMKVYTPSLRRCVPSVVLTLL